MKFVIILEDDLYLQRQIVEALEAVDPKMCLRGFNQLKDYAEWFQRMMTEGPKSLESAGEHIGGAEATPNQDKDPHRLALVVSKIEFMGERQMDLIAKSLKILIGKNLCTEADPTAVVLTAFPEKNINLMALQKTFITNLLYKPFDRLLLQQHLSFAVSGHHPPNQIAIANQKTNIQIEMLKSVDVEQLGEIGFVTRSDQAIPVGSISKYYGDAFSTDKHRSVIARCVECIKHPKIENFYQGKFEYYSIDNDQISLMRKKVLEKTAIRSNINWWSNPIHPQKHHGLIISHGNVELIGLKSVLESNFDNLHVTTTDHEGKLLNDIDPTQHVKALNLSKDPATPLNLDIKFIISPDKNEIVGFEPPIADNDKIFGKAAKEWMGPFSKKIFWSQSESHNILRDAFGHGKVNLNEQAIVSFLNEDGSIHYARILSAEKKPNQDGHIVNEVLFHPLSESEILRVKLSKLSIKGPIEFVMLDADIYLGKDEKFWIEFEAKLKQHQDLMQWQGPAISWFLFSKKHLPDQMERKIAGHIKDFFFMPLDRVYFLKKIKAEIESLNFGAKIEEPKTIVYQDLIKSAMPVTVKEISEAGLVMEYHRSIDLGTFREFILWREDEVNVPEVLGNCNFFEKEAKTTKNHFVFFGVSDHIAKYLRVWIREAYIHAKNANG
jgi:hypothetical protein